MKISEIITDKYKLRIPPTVYYELLADVQEAEEQEPTTKNDLVVDCISRADALDCVNWGYSFSDIYKKINELPLVTPQEPKTGHWIIDTHKIRAFGKKNETHDYSVHCDKCNYAWDYTTDKEGSLVSNYCPNCGADMRGEEV